MTDVSAEKFDVICRLCTSSLVDDGAYEIFADSADSPKSIHKKITFCLQLKVPTSLFITAFKSYCPDAAIYHARYLCNYHPYRTPTSLLIYLLSIEIEKLTIENRVIFASCMVQDTL